VSRQGEKKTASHFGGRLIPSIHYLRKHGKLHRGARAHSCGKKKGNRRITSTTKRGGSLKGSSAPSSWGRKKKGLVVTPRGKHRDKTERRKKGL